MPDWIVFLASGSLLISGLCALVILVDILRGYRQHMWIMNVVWPITALYSGPAGLWAYFAIGRGTTHRQMHGAQNDGGHDGEHGKPERPFWQTAGLATTHCGSGCTLGDILAEAVVLPLLPFTLFGHRIFAAWTVDFVFAFLIGIAFQYFTIKPMKQISVAQGLKGALQADTLSLIAWQVGMYGWMAIAMFVIFPHGIDASSPVFWFMMQIAMLAGFATSYPVNRWLLRVGIKHPM